MEKADLIKKIAEILGVNKPKDDLAFEIFLEKISEKLNFNEAIRIPGVGIFQLREEPFTGVKKTFAGVDAGNKTELMFAPFLKDSDSLYITFETKKVKKKSNDFSDDVFSIGVEKPIIPISGNQNEILDSDTSYILVRKSLGELIDKLFDKSDHLENFDLWDDFINSQRASEYEILEEVVLDEQFEEIEEAAKDISADENKELNNIEVEEDSQELSENSKEDLFELDDFDIKEETAESVDQEKDNQEDIGTAEVSPEDNDTSELFDEIGEEESLVDENISAEEKPKGSEDLLGDDLLDFDSLGEEEDIDLNDSEIDEIQDLLSEEDSGLPKEIPDQSKTEELKEDDFDLSEDELNELLENEDDIDDDWDWGDELKQEIVDADEDESVQDEFEDQIDDNSDDLFDQLEESIHEDSSDDFDDDEVDESLLNLEEELKDEPSTEKDTSSSKESEEAETDEESENTNSKDDDKLDSLLQKKDKKLSFMAKIKQKLGMFFWVLVGIFVVTTMGGIYYFLFIPKEVNLDDPLLDEYNTVVLDSTQQDTTKKTALSDSVINAPKDSIQNTLDKDDAQEVVKDETKKIDVIETPIIDKSATNQQQKSNIREQKPVQKDKTVDQKIISSSIKFVENPKETKIGNSHIYKSNNKYSVQVSSWRKKAQAEKEANKLITAGLDVFIVKVYLRSLSSTWYRVRVGEFSTLEEAKEFEKKNK